MTLLKDVFISYGRKDSQTFAKELRRHLENHGYSVWRDFEDIPSAVDFQKQIDAAIPAADNFIFIISPHATNSEYCLKEIELAISFNKRIIPIMHVEKISQHTWQERNPDGTDDEWQAYQNKGLHSCYTHMHPEIQKINWTQLNFSDPHNFERPFQALIDSIQKENIYVHQHTELLNQAFEWDLNQQQSRYLLVGQARQQAEQWLKHRFEYILPPCVPADLHCEFITESIKNANNLMTQVFLCHAEEDRDITEQVRRILMRVGITTWTYQTDIAYGSDFQSAMNQGVEESDNVLFLMSPEAFQSEYCQKELAKALELNKRIIPLQVKPLRLSQVPERLRNLQHIDLTACHSEADYQHHAQRLLRILQEDAPYFREHKVLLTKALKWQQHRNPCILLRGYELRHALTWLKVAQNRTLHGPTPLQLEFITESQRQPAEVYPDIFISYSRVESGFARKLNDRLQQHGKRTWFDQESIASGVDFKEEIYKGIAASHYFLFVLSPRSVSSVYCAEEVEYAISLNKQIVTVLHEPVNTEMLHPELAKIQWIDFNTQRGNFTASFQELIKRLDTDSEYSEVHRRLLLRAIEWEQKQRRSDFLLQGNDLAEAEQWLLESANKDPRPTELQGKYISASRKFSTNKQRKLVAVLGSLLAIAIGASGVAWQKAIIAADKTKLADSQRQEAVAARNNEKAQRIVAEQSEQRAKNARDAAIKAEKAEKAQRDIALEEEQKAIQAKNNAIAAQSAEKAQREIAEQKEQEAIKERNNAEIARKEEAEQRAEAEKQTQIAREEAQIAEVRAHLSQTEAFLLRESPMEGMISAIKAGETIFPEGALSDEATAYALAALQQITYPAIPVEKQTLPIFRESNRLDQQETVNSVSFSPDGQLIVSGGQNGTLKLWNVQGKLISCIKGHNAVVKSVSFSPDGQLIVSSAEDGTLILWDSAGNKIKTLQDNPNENFSSVSFSPNGQLIISSSKDGTNNTIKLWNLRGKNLTTLSDKGAFILAVRLSPDNRHMVVARKDNTLKLLDLKGTLVTAFQGHDKYVRDVRFSLDGELIASASKDKTIKLWNYDGQLIANLKGHKDEVNSVSFSPNSQLIVSGSKDNTVKLWSRDGKPITTLKGHQGDVQSVSFSANSIASGSNDRTIKLWNHYESPIQNGQDSHASEQDINFAWEDGILQLLDAAGNPMLTLKGHSEEVYSVSISPDGQLIATAGRDPTIKLWTRSGQLIQTFSGHQDIVNSLDFSPDGKTIVSGSDDATIKLWSTDGAGETITLRGHQGPVYSVRFDPDGQTIASGSEDKTVKLWSRHTGTELATLVDHSRSVVSVRFLQEGQQLQSRDDGGNIIYWDRNLGRLLRRNCALLQPYLQNNAEGKLEASKGLCQSL